MKLNWPLLALATGAFGIGTTEFAPMGMLPVIAQDLGVSIPSTGLLVTGYALGVVVGAPLLTLTTGRFDRKWLLLGLMALFTTGNLLSAVAPGYGTLMAARVVTALCHGSFFGVGSIVAAGLVGEERRAGAVAAMFSGLTIANIGGVPLAAWVSAHVGWRTAFAGIGGLGVVALIALSLALPRMPGNPRGNLSRELGVMRRGAVVAALLTTALGSAAMFTVFTYIAPILRDVTGVGPDMVTVALVIYGVGLTIGNWLGGRFGDRALHRTLVVVLMLLTALLLLFALTMHSSFAAVATIFAWGIATFALVPPLQSRVMLLATEAPSLAASINIGAFNAGNALGAAAGGAVIALGLGYPWVAVAGATMSGAALLLVLAAPR